MNTQLAPVTPDKISTLVDHDRDGRVVIAFCPICDWTAEANHNGRSHEDAASACVLEVELHIRKKHRSKTKN